MDEKKDKVQEEAKKDEELKKEINEFFPQLPPAVETKKEEDKTPPPPEVTGKQESKEPPVVTSVTEDTKKEETLPPTKEEIALLETKKDNLKKAIYEEEGILAKKRRERSEELKLLQEELEVTKVKLEEAKKVAEQDTTDIDPEMEKIMLPIIEKRERIREQERQEKQKKQDEEEAKVKVDFYVKNYEEVKIKHPDFDVMVKQYFDPAVKYDDKLNAELLKSDNPAEFAYQEAIKIKEKLLKPEVDAAVKKTKQEILTELNKTGQRLPISLSGVPGGSPQEGITSTPLQKEISEL